MSATELTSNIAICYECDKVYLLDLGHTMRDGLPCGHSRVCFFVPSSLASARADSLFVDWAEREGLLDVAMDELDMLGGSFDPTGRGSARFRAPKED